MEESHGTRRAPRRGFRTQLLRESAFGREFDARACVLAAIAYEEGLRAPTPAPTPVSPSSPPRSHPRIMQSLRPFWLRPPRQRPIVLPCPLGNDGEVWSSRRQRTRDGAHRLRGPFKADVQSSLHQPQPQSGPRGPASREAVGPTARGATSGRAREKTGASIKVVPRRHPSLGSMARDGFLLALERNALWRCPMTSSPLRRR